MNKKLVFGVLIAAGLAFLFTRSETETHSTPTSLSTPADSDSAGPDATSSTPRSNPSFAGDPCTSDCSGHEAGYNWAEEKGIDDEDDCDAAGDTSNSPSFAEGCRTYVRENASSDDTDDDSGN
jgi:hypothetical protein